MTTFIAGATFDYVCHALTCPRCGQTAREPCAVDLQTKLSARPTMRHLRVGDPFDLRDDLLTGGYLVTGPHGESLRVLEAWACPECGANFLWALLELHDGVLKSVEPAALDNSTLSSAHLITGEVLALFPVDRTLDLVALPSPELRVQIARAEAARLAELAR